MKKMKQKFQKYFLISIFLLLNLTNILGQRISIDENGKVFINDTLVTGVGLSLQNFNKIIKSAPSKSKFDRVCGEPLGTRFFFYEHLGVVTSSSPTKRFSKRYVKHWLEIFYQHYNERYYSDLTSFNGILVINNYVINRYTSFDDICQNEKLKKFAHEKIGSRKTKTVLELEIGQRRTQVLITFENELGLKVSEIAIPLY
jgi:hypothetical protein